MKEGLFHLKDSTDALIGSKNIFNVAQNLVGEAIPKDGLWGLSKEVLEGVIGFGLFPSPSSTEPKSYESLLDLAQQASQLERDLILSAIGQGNNFGLAPYELRILATSCQLGRYYDQLCKKARAQYQAMEEGGNNFTNPYAVLIKSSDGRVIETPYSVAYPEETQAIVSGWRQMIEDPLFQKTGDENEKDRKALRDFFEAYARAIENSDPEMNGSLWFEVDDKFLRLNTRLQPLPGREKLYDDQRIFPDLRLAFKLSFSDENLEKILKEEFNGIRGFLDSRYPKRPVYQRTRCLLDPNNLISFDIRELVRAGRTWDFPYSAQSLPDNPEDFGNRRKIITCSYLMGPRAYLSSLLVERMGAGSMFAHGFLDINQAVIIGGHELGEPIFETAEIKKKMDPLIWANLNEDRATLIATGTVRWLYEKGRLNFQDLINNVTRLLGISLRYLQVSQGSEAMRPYRIMSLLILRRMIDSGLLVKDRGFGWKINFSDIENGQIKTKEISRFYELSLIDLDKQVEIMGTGDSDKASWYLNYAQETAEISDLFEWCHQLLPPTRGARGGG